ALSSFYRVITPDSRGHGRTDSSEEPVTYPLITDDFVQFIHVLGLNKPFVAGYSDGGQIAKHMAINHPGLARAYMIGGIFNTMTAEWQGLMQGMLGFKGLGMVDIERVEQQNPAVVRDLQEKHGSYRERDYWKALLIQSSQRWWSPAELTQADFVKISDPTLFWCGDRDVFCPPEQSLELYRMVKGAELAVIPNADHFIILQQIEIANMVLLNFMERVIGPQS
ncbi:MAG TPA: alpha/beta hydrolase, partial [candidate division Zixibacteria bacterium]|nr:alpha/beta hydrolase [candidate division Zixibacteria bacterium]